MKALVYHGNRDVRYEDTPDPTPSENDALIKIDYCGICATDIEEYQLGPKFIEHERPNQLTGRMLPIIIGHELTGTVVDLGRNNIDVEVGNRVVINGVLTCDKCWWCINGPKNQCPYSASVGFGADGGLAEYIVWPANQVITLPDNVSSEEAGLVEPASVAHHAIRRGKVTPSSRVVILGAGTVGLLAIQIAKAMGAWVGAIDIKDLSLQYAREMGADLTINSKTNNCQDEVANLTDGMGADIVIDSAGGSETPSLAIDIVRRGGIVVMVGIYTSTPQFDFNSVLMKEVEISGSLGYEHKDVESAVHLISDGKIKTSSLISGIIKLGEVLEVGYPRMMAPTKDIFRLLVSPD